MNKINSYRFIYLLLFKFIESEPKNTLFQFFLKRNVEVSSLLLSFIFAFFINSETSTIQLILAITHLVISFIFGEVYLKIIPNARAIYLSNTIVSLYVLLNAFAIYAVQFFFIMIFTLPDGLLLDSTLPLLLLFLINTLFSDVFNILNFILN